MNSFLNLIEQNQQAQQLFADHEDPNVGILNSLCCQLCKLLDYELIYQLRQEKDLDKLTLLIRDKVMISFPALFQFWQKHTCPPLDPALSLLYAGIAHELFVRGVLHDDNVRNPQFPYISIPDFSGTPYAIHLQLLKIESDVIEATQHERLTDLQEQYWAERSTNLSIDAGKEHLISLAPAAKARVLRNAVEKLNEVGVARPTGSRR